MLITHKKNRWEMQSINLPPLHYRNKKRENCSEHIRLRIDQHLVLLDLVRLDLAGMS